MKKLVKYLMGSIVFLILMSACNAASEQEEPLAMEMEQTDYSKLADSLDLAIILEIDQNNKEITFMSKTLSKQYKLNYDGGTRFKNKYQEELVIDQVNVGDLVYSTFQKDGKKLIGVWQYEDAFRESGISGFEMNRAARTLYYKDKQWDLSKNLTILSDQEEIDLMDINEVDTLRICGTDHTIDSIVVEKGHGYIRLDNDEYFIGGWIEIGQDIIKPVAEDMLLCVPEGTYMALITHEGHGGEKEITIQKNKETILDIADLYNGEVKEGEILFTVTPDDAKLLVDGKQVDYSDKIPLTYGIHQLIFQKQGYETLKKYIKVGSALANINIVMDEKVDDEEDEDESKPLEQDSSDANEQNTTQPLDDDPQSTSQNAITPTSAYKVYLDAPTGAEVYVDGSYVGVIPTSFPKKVGTFTVSLRKTNYVTRSYTLQIGSDQKDVSYSFSDLVKQSGNED